MRPALLVTVLRAATFATAPTWAQAVDTSEWKLEQNTSWDFAVSLPPGWTILDMHMGDLRLAVRQDLSGGRKLMCQVHAGPEPKTAGLNQGQLNDFISGKGAPPAQEAGPTLSATGYPTRIYSIPSSG